MKRALPYLAVAGAIALGFFAWRAHKILVDRLPPRIECSTVIEAFSSADSYYRTHGGKIYAVLATGSMRPYIPEAFEGEDPEKTIVAYVVTKKDAIFEDVELGDLCIYDARWRPAGAPPVIHVASSKDSAGFIMSGLGNKRSEPLYRVDRENFRGIVAVTFVLRR